MICSAVNCTSKASLVNYSNRVINYSPLQTDHAVLLFLVPSNNLAEPL